METPEQLNEAAERSGRVGAEMKDQLRWIRTYVTDEGDGSMGTACVIQATSQDVVREHSARALLPIDEVLEVTGTLVVSPDPEPAPSVDA